MPFETCCDTEIILNGYLEYGTDFVTRIVRIFAFAILDPFRLSLSCSDRMGVAFTVLHGIERPRLSLLL